ncbi:hypothetical protein TNCV_1809831 [Trichonephila clavipes]|nr:hypothetical protein TNCV_1809831 [Trichonephila clavipes]
MQTELVPEPDEIGNVIEEIVYLAKKINLEVDSVMSPSHATNKWVGVVSNPSTSGRCKKFQSKLADRFHKSKLRSLVESKYNLSRQEEITLSKSPHYAHGWNTKNLTSLVEVVFAESKSPHYTHGRSTKIYLSRRKVIAD